MSNKRVDTKKLTNKNTNSIGRNQLDAFSGC